MLTVPSLFRDMGGPPHVVQSLADGLAALGARVAVVTLDEGGDRALSPRNPTVELLRAPCVAHRKISLLWGPSFSRLLDAYCRRRPVSLIHDSGLWLPTHHASCRIARRHRIPLVISPQGMLEPWALRQKAWKKRAAWWIYQRRDLEEAAMLHASHRREAEGLRRLGLRQPIAVVPNGIDIPPLEELPPRRSGSEPRTLLFLSRIHPKKGLSNLIAAWARLRPRGWRALIAGPDEHHRPQLEREVADARLEEAFSFVEPVYGHAKWALMRRADLFVLPTYSENFGIAVAEALACELPVITTRGAPWQELVSRRCGWWIDVGVKPLEAALREAFELSDEERRAMGARGRPFVERAFSAERVAQRMWQAHRWLLEGGPRPEVIWR